MRSRCTAAGNSTPSLTGLSSATAVSFSWKTSFLPLVRPEHQVSRHHYANRKAQPDRQGRLDVQIPPNHLLACLVEGIPCPTAKCLDVGAVAVAYIRAGSELSSYSKQGEKQRRVG